MLVVVAELLKKRVVYISPKDSLRSAANLMHKNNIGSLVVCDNKRLVGIITERDIVKAVSEGKSPDETMVEEEMSRNLITARPEESLVQVANKMIHHGIRHLPVVDETNKVLGIISIRDVLRHLMSEHEFP